MTPHKELAHVWDTANPPGVALALAGSLTVDNVPGVYDSLDERLRPGAPVVRFAVDCTGVSECDSAGLALLLELRRRTSRAGGEFDLTASPVLLRLLELTGTVEHLNVPHPRSSEQDRFTHQA